MPLLYGSAHRPLLDISFSSLAVFLCAAVRGAYGRIPNGVLHCLHRLLLRTRCSGWPAAVRWKSVNAVTFNVTNWRTDRRRTDGRAAGVLALYRTRNMAFAGMRTMPWFCVLVLKRLF